MLKPKLEYENGEPVLKCEYNGASITLAFAKEEPAVDTKSAVLDILTAKYFPENNRGAARHIRQTKEG